MVLMKESPFPSCREHINGADVGTGKGIYSSRLGDRKDGLNESRDIGHCNGEGEGAQQR